MKKIVPINTEVVLDEIEQLISKAIAKKRYENNRKKNIEDKKIGKQTNAATDIEGFGAEMAFCKLFNVFPDFSVFVRSTKSDKGDAELHVINGVVDVKSTKYLDGRLLTPDYKEKGVVDLYALMIGEFPKYVFKGFMTSAELMQDHRIGDMGYGKKSYIAAQSELKPTGIPI